METIYATFIMDNKRVTRELGGKSYVDTFTNLLTEPVYYSEGWIITDKSTNKTYFATETTTPDNQSAELHPWKEIQLKRLTLKNQHGQKVLETYGFWERLKSVLNSANAV